MATHNHSVSEPIVVCLTKLFDIRNAINLHSILLNVQFDIFTNNGCHQLFKTSYVPSDKDDFIYWHHIVL